MTDEYEVADAAPTDSEGHPVHPDPDKSHRICGATKSDRTTPTKHGRERDDYAYCLLPAGWGTDSNVGACRNHPYRGSQLGEANPNYNGGGYARYLSPANYTDDEERRARAVSVDLADPERRDNVFRSLISDLWVRYDRTHDPRYAREIRQSLDDYGFTPEEARQLHVEHSGAVGVEHDVPDHVVEAIIGASEANLEGDNS